MNNSIFNPSTGSRCDYIDPYGKCAVYTGYNREITELAIFAGIAWHSYISMKPSTLSTAITSLPAVTFVLAPALFLGNLLLKTSNHGYVLEPMNASYELIQGYSNITLDSHKTYGTDQFNHTIREFSHLQSLCAKEGTCTRLTPPPPIAAHWNDNNSVHEAIPLVETKESFYIHF